jgi:hypothetical protein
VNAVDDRPLHQLVLLDECVELFRGDEVVVHSVDLTGAGRAGRGRHTHFQIRPHLHQLRNDRLFAHGSRSRNDDEATNETPWLYPLGQPDEFTTKSGALIDPKPPDGRPRINTQILENSS